MTTVVEETATTEPVHRRPRRSRRRVWIAVVTLVVVVVSGVYGAYRLARAEADGRDGKSALLRVEAGLRQMDPDRAEAATAQARAAFASMNRELDTLGPLRTVARAVPFVRTHVRSVETVAEVGSLLSASAEDLTRTSAALLHPDEPSLTLAEGLDRLTAVRRSLARALPPLTRAAADVDRLRDLRLLGPLGSTRDELLERLPEALVTAEDAADALDALTAFAGAGGPRRYLVLTQNPDEIRPTGGFIGTYGVLTSDGRTLKLERYEPIQRWPALDTAVVPAAQAPTPFRLPDEDRDQQLANVNATASWRDAAELAAKLWVAGGEKPIDGVIGITPETLAAIVRVLGPVEVPAYGERVTGANLIDRVDYYAHRAGLEVGRKQFLADLASVVIDRLLEAPATDWVPVGRALATSLDARETMVWATDQHVDRVVTERSWDGVLPRVGGDFFYVGEFEYSNKNGRALRRTFDHRVVIRPDGSARITTKVTTSNVRPPNTARGENLNVDAVRYATVYGPSGAALAPGTDAPIAVEPQMSGHPAFGFETTAPPLGQSSFTVVWDAPGVVVDGSDGPEYQLTWLRIPAHAGDQLHLQVELPDAWKWANDAPPSQLRLNEDLHGSWRIDRKSP